MSLSTVENPFDTFLNLVGGGLNGGDVYIGVENMDPQTNPQAVYWDAAGTIPAAQPLEVQGGYVMRLGTPARAYVNNNYSIRVLDRFGVQVFYAASVPLLSAATISFLQAGSGAVPRTVQAKLREVAFSVKDFGAVGDFAADDTAAIQATIDAAASLGVGPVVFPPGTYRITDTLKMRPGVVLRGAKGLSSIKQGAGEDLRFLIDWNTYLAHGSGLDSLTVDGNWLNNSRTMDVERFALFISQANDVTVRNCDIGSFAGHGVHVDLGVRPVIENNAVHDVSRYGITIASPNSISENRPWIIGNVLNNVAWHNIIVLKSRRSRIEGNDITAQRVSGLTVTVVGTTVTWVSGPNFSTIQPGNFVIYNGGIEALVMAKVSDTQVTIQAATGDVVGAPAAYGAADLISSHASLSTIITDNRTNGGASAAISIFGSDDGNDQFCQVLGNDVSNSGASGLVVTTIGAGYVSGTQFRGNSVVSAGLNGAASNVSYNGGCVVQGDARNIEVTDNSFLSNSSGMLGLNALATGANVRVGGNRYDVTDPQITNGATVALSAGWNGATVSQLIVLDDVLSFLVTTTATPPAANPNFTITHRTIPTRGKIATAVNSATSNTLLAVGTFYPETPTQTIIPIAGTPAASATYRFVVRL